VWLPVTLASGHAASAGSAPAAPTNDPEPQPGRTPDSHEVLMAAGRDGYRAMRTVLGRTSRG
jgi:hypothetical protein